MKFGMMMVFVSLVATILSAMLYFLSAWKEQNIIPRSKKKSGAKINTHQNWARSFYYLASSFIFITALYLMYLILTHQFQVRYVYQYSSRDLPLGILISTFWAGQEGSFLLWTVCTALMGMLLIRTNKGLEKVSMVLVNIVQIFFLLMLVQASPFRLMEGLPADGAGLNPLLQNFWMVIHPPILFIGYAAITFPFVLAISSLLRKEYDSWIAAAMPWTVFSSLTLGAGIIIGGFWAYETLGWGGYWGWDPVENSSLIPWLTTLALLHGMIVQKRNGSLRRVNYIFAILSYLLVIYATFLTRSGVLADFSVHSFQNLGINSFLIVFMVSMVVVSFWVFLSRSKLLAKQPVDISAPNRENALVVSLWLFAATAFLTFIGTSSPIITGLLGKASQVDISFYNKVNLPVGVLMALMLGITPFLYWVEKEVRSIPVRLVVPFISALFAAVAIYLSGLHELHYVLFGFAAVFALVSNVIVLVRQGRINWMNTAGPLTHFGVGIIFVGIIISGNFAQNQQLVLPKDVPVQALGYQLTYQGFTQVDNGKNIANIHMTDGKNEHLARPRLYMSEYNRELMREPDIVPGVFADLYLSPLEHRSGHTHGQTVILKKGERKQVAEYDILFTGFEMSNHEQMGAFSVSAVLEISKNGLTSVIKPALMMMKKEKQTIPVSLPGAAQKDSASTPTVALNNLNADEKVIELVFTGIDQEKEAQADVAEQLVVEFSKKPFMSILWTGSVLLILGTIISFKKRLSGN